jgi:hypothetical protein
MEQQAVRKPYQYQLKPTPVQERELARVRWACRTLYHVAVEQRITAWQRRRVSVSRYQQDSRKPR